MSLRTICDRCEKIIELGTAVAKLELKSPGVEAESAPTKEGELI